MSVIAANLHLATGLACKRTLGEQLPLLAAVSDRALLSALPLLLNKVSERYTVINVATASLQAEGAFRCSRGSLKPALLLQSSRLPVQLLWYCNCCLGSSC